ncbi:Doubled CXXCH motif (Paired_CXXCH_1) [Allochromatium warmingii]|uniref:Doubled CXXCH motif (Paired_CXXCH_1) n=1 Tax=Allochromatium warmingii TaxID=61595 RepID=A0A1H3CLZ7_ALLWA|nr:cytochrome c3 family protein [Allochromatium warmingii]SDX55060.1 Doubled CXXCH motif (Paired_CXXCH_1) [Allochromatium warmingii]
MHNRLTKRASGWLAGAVLLSALLGTSSTSTAAIHGQLGTDNSDCLRCHRMETLAYRDPQSGELVDLHVNGEQFGHSAHAEVPCIDCHQGDFGQYPHPAAALAQRLDCVGCHEDQPDAHERAYRFQTIEQEFARSIHATSDSPKVKGFNCHHCHDPHTFRNSAIGQPIAEIVRSDNQLCLSCHSKIREPYSTAHLWLPKRDKHWQAVRCLECHTPLTDLGQPVSHQLLAGKDSNFDCVNCHSQEQRLLQRLYQYRSATDLENSGWLSKAILNQSYVVGMSRSPLLDALGLGVMGLTLCVLIAHGWGRYRAYRRFRQHQLEQ